MSKVAQERFSAFIAARFDLPVATIQAALWERHGVLMNADRIAREIVVARRASFHIAARELERQS